MNSKLSGNITINPTLEKTSSKESILNGTDPILKDELIPVIITEDGVVRKADEASEWYSYEEKNWANTVILNDENEVYCPGDIIPEDNIESYFVWIPKYRYQLWDLGNYSSLTSINNTKPHEIPILFGDYNTNDNIDGECTTPMTSGASGNCQIGDYMTHPAFISFDIKGLWVGKFETGYKGSTDKISAESNTKEPEKVQIKPNVNSWRNIQVAHAYVTSFDYKRNLDSHMMKNTEWGAVSYLQHSKYGSMVSVRLNNNSNYVTGYSAVKEPTCGVTGDNRDCNRYGSTEDITKPWNTDTGYLASTTGNISGVYDISGGAIERVMGVVSDKNGNPIIGYDSNQNSGFNGVLSNGTRKNDGFSFPSDSKYYDIYQYNTNQQSYLKRILGDATGEMGPFANVIYGTQNNTIGSWYDDASRFVYLDNPWFQRGGGIIQGSHAGMFYFVNFAGQAGNTGGFRLILSI